MLHYGVMQLFVHAVSQYQAIRSSYCVLQKVATWLLPKIIISRSGNVLTHNVFEGLIYHFKALSLLYKVSGKCLLKFINGGGMGLDIHTIMCYAMKFRLTSVKNTSLVQ